MPSVPSVPSAPRRGRPPAGTSDARARLVRSAREHFLADGYRGATLRAIAADAGVDVALVAYHFGSKSGLFVEAMALSLGPSQVLDAALAAPRAALPALLVDAVVRAWDDPVHGPALVRLVEAALTDAAVLRAFQGYVQREVVDRLVEHLGGARATASATAVTTVVVGLVTSRHLLRLPHATRATRAELVRALAPAIEGATRPRSPGLSRADPRRTR